ncbi:glycoside hydrolase family 2 protein [Cellulomonas soli]|uniref:Beta-galactosidase n=1 Tax=Cellulomonas soli TaxID=931535 RepID=A0A512PD72_9CELL|nr:glycoside hydrolase family 2 TIM barrel-domain containing protein [Cellulomonas soli]NYI60263.1 hypothetical protein [Cellulomonas soli]GEP69082.1 beta-galactosidase [Cellulomonas soli]
MTSLPGLAAVSARREDFNRGWAFRRKVTAFQELGGADGAPWTEVTLPHDALVGGPRSADVPGGETSGYFVGGVFEYRASYVAPETDRGSQVHLEFDGVYRDAMVYVNGALAGQNAFGYSRFLVRIDPFLRFGADNEIRVACRSHVDSRWYTGAGIYRDVHLVVKPSVHIALDGVRVTTPDVDRLRALVEVAVDLENAGPVTAGMRLDTVILDAAGGRVAFDSQPVTLLPGDVLVARSRISVPSPALWSAEDPALHRAVVELRDGETVVDVQEVTFGVRTLQVDAEHGLRVNGEPVALRGACIHGDNGPLGAAAIGRAEERKIELLKRAGFNAIRSSHHPASPALLDACDRIGMYVMDETFDMWTSGKTDFDYASDFAQWWERDVEAMVAKDRNHPSVIFYSIGNEIPELGSGAGGRWSRLIAQKVRELDPTRLVTNGVNGFVAVLDSVLDGMQQRRAAAAEAGPGDDRAEGAGVNGMMTAMGQFMDQLQASPMVTARTEESYAALDVAGMNYGEARYEGDRELFPNRVIVGTETWPAQIDRNWDLVTRLPHVIGDFTWTGMDYLGETGIGVVRYADEVGGGSGFSTGYPGLTAGCGDLDITGSARTLSAYRQTVFGLRSQPAIAVHRPANRDRPVAVSTPWSWSDTVESWTWPGFEGRTVQVDVYSDADEVELQVNGAPAGRAKVGESKAFVAEVDVTYQPGELTAVALRDGVEISRASLRSASEVVQLSVVPDRAQLTAESSDLAFVDIALTDENGRLQVWAERVVHVSVTGSGVLQGLGSGAPVTEESFTDPQRRTYDGRALAVVRPTGRGGITVVVSAAGCAPVSIELHVA